MKLTIFVRLFLSSFLATLTVGSVTCREEPFSTYNLSSIETSGIEFCPSTENLREAIQEDVYSFLNKSMLPGYRACGCGGHGWRRAAYLNISDPTQTCPPAWELIATPRRTCARPSNAGSNSCYSAMFPTQGVQYSQVCGRIIGYQVGQPEAFFAGRELNERYVDGVSLTYGSPRQHIWTFANELDEYPHSYGSRCPCTNVREQRTINVPFFVRNDYFCETGVPPGQQFRSIFYANDPLWDGGGCGPTSTCCTFNKPPWFCKQLPQSINADLEVRLCSLASARIENTPIELIEVYIK